MSQKRHIGPETPQDALRLQGCDSESLRFLTQEGVFAEKGPLFTVKGASAPRPPPPPTPKFPVDTPGPSPPPSPGRPPSLGFSVKPPTAPRRGGGGRGARGVYGEFGGWAGGGGRGPFFREKGHFSAKTPSMRFL